jgi:hypothetical protein
MWPSLVFYFDASVQRPVFDAVALVRDGDVSYPGVGACPVANRSMKDSEWLPVVGELGWPVVMRDKRIKERPLERHRFKEYAMKGFVLTGAGNYSRWRTLDLIVRRWDDMTEKAVEEPGPFMYSVTQRGLSLLTL